MTKVTTLKDMGVEAHLQSIFTDSGICSLNSGLIPDEYHPQNGSYTAVCPKCGVTYRVTYTPSNGGGITRFSVENIKPPKRVIRAHKHGRTIRRPALMTLETYERLKELKRTRGKSVGDVLLAGVAALTGDE